MIHRIWNKLKFHLERLALRGAHYRLLVIAALIGLISAGAGLLVIAVTTDFGSAGEGMWWAFLRLTDPGYLGDDRGFKLRVISTAVTVLGYVLFMGSLIAILTQWLSQTIETLQKGFTPIVQSNHILVLGWSNRTATIVKELLMSEGRVRRFLRRHGSRTLRIVILCEELTPELRYALRDYLGPLWNEKQIVFRSGSPLRIEHLRRMDFMNAAAIIIPGSDFEWGGSNAADMRTTKTLLSINNYGGLQGNARLPFLVAEIFDARKIPVARSAYGGKLEVLASDSLISLLIAQNVRHRRLSHVYTELLTHSEESNEIYIRSCPEFENVPLQDLTDAFPRAVLLGVLRFEGQELRPLLNPANGLLVGGSDRLVFLARSYRETEPLPGYTPRPTRRGTQAEAMETQAERRILLMGWNDKIPALIHEFDNYENETFQVDILSTLPVGERDQRLARYALHPERVRIRQLEGDYSAPADLARFQPEDYDNVVIVGCDWLESKEEADARTILGHLLLRGLLADKEKKPDLLLELLDPENHTLFQGEMDEVLISPMILSHILAQVALRPELNVVFHELFSSGGAEIYLRPAAWYDLVGRELSFRELQEAVALAGETALGVRICRDGQEGPGVRLNPDRRVGWKFAYGDEVIVLATYS